MALFDPERKRIVIRVIYDGPGFAGKTTNLRRLCKSYASWRRSDMVSPNTMGERTQFFDWLEVDGGLLRSYPVRAQLLTVPGQVELTLRRQFVIEHADVVVFVADSQRDNVEEARGFYAQLCEQLDGFAHRVPIVFQANKQDSPGALKPAKLAKLVSEGLRKPDKIKGSVATNDKGVKQTLMVALQLASEGLRTRWRDTDPKTQVGEVGDAAKTLAAMEHRESQRARGRPAQLRPKLPTPDTPSTQLWPALTGRELLERLHGQAMQRVSSAEHPERFMLEVDAWRLQTSTDRHFETLDDARGAMHQLCSRKVALGSWLPEPSVVTVVDDPETRCAWLWTIDPILPRLAQQLDERDVDRRREALLRFAEIALGAEALAERHGLLVELTPEVFAEQLDATSGRRWTRYIGELTAGESIDIVAPLLGLARAFEDDEVALADYREVLCLGLYQVPVTPQRRAELRQAFMDAAIDVDARGARSVRDAAALVLHRPVARDA